MEITNNLSAITNCYNSKGREFKHTQPRTIQGAHSLTTTRVHVLNSATRTRTPAPSFVISSTKFPHSHPQTARSLCHSLTHSLTLPLQRAVCLCLRRRGCGVAKGAINGAWSVVQRDVSCTRPPPPGLWYVCVFVCVCERVRAAAVSTHSLITQPIHIIDRSPQHH